MPLLIEAIRQWVEEAGGSLDDKVYRVRRAFHKWYNEGLSWERMAWVLDVFEDHIMVQYGERTFRVDYSIDSDDVITFADTPWPVYVLRYVPAEDAAAEPAEDTTGMGEAVREAVKLTVKLAEAAKDDDGLFPGSVIVVEGVSANNNEYTAAALESGVSIFEGARLVADHEIEEGESARPEGSVHDVIGKVTNIRLGEHDGNPALLGDVFISESETKIRTKVKEGILGDLSIRAWGAGTRADDGHFVVESFQPHPYTNIAMVTVGAAGGKLVSESQQPPEPDSGDDEQQPVTEAPRREVRALRESESDQQLREVTEERDHLLEENTQLFREYRTMQADTAITEAIQQAGELPAATLTRIRHHAAMLKETFVTHGSAQTVDEFHDAVNGLVEGERSYLAQVTPNGAVSGLTAHGDSAGDVEDILTEAFEGLVPEGAVQVAVRGRG